MTSPWLRPLAAATFWLAIAGCSVTPTHDSGILAPVTRAGTEYQQAQERYANDPAVIRLYQDRLVELALTLARHHQRQGNWYAAEQTLRHASSYLPEQPRLSEAMAEIAHGRQRQLQYNQDRELVAKAIYALARHENLIEQGRLQAPDYLDDWNLKRNREKLNALAQPLRNCALRNLERDQLSLATQCVELAEAVKDRSFVADIRQTLDARLAPPETADAEGEPKPASPPPPKATKPNPARDDAKAAELRADLTEAMNAGDLVKARSITRQLLALNGKTPQLLDLQHSLDTAISTQIESLHELANEHYRSQRYQEAKAAWEEVLKLDPDDAQATTLIERADRVIKKIETLHKEEEQTLDAPKP